LHPKTPTAPRAEGSGAPTKLPDINMPTAEEVFGSKPSQTNSDAGADPSPAMQIADRECARLLVEALLEGPTSVRPKRRKPMAVKAAPPDAEFFKQTKAEEPKAEATNGHKPCFDPPKPNDAGEKVSIDVAIKHLPTWRSLSWEAIKRENKPPVLFRYSNNIVRLSRADDGGIRIEIVTADIMRHHLADWAHWHKDQIKLALLPVELVKDVLALSDPPLPILRRVVYAPVFTADGELLLKPGYDKES